jgi:APA family basic amino acid/polyamine antiporter
MLGSGFTLAVIIGGIIGLGILRTPGEVAAVVSDPLMFASLWVLGGLFILLRTVVVAELVGMTPRSGGPTPWCDVPTGRSPKEAASG